MNFRLIFYVVGNFLKYFGFLMLIPAVISLIYGDNELFAFILTSFATTTTGYILEIITKKAAVLKEIKRQEGFLIAALCWVLACLFGSLPYLLLSVFSHPVDAIFESFSGFTTTGATVLSEIESLPHGILFYRSFTQWLGGMGIIILAIAILPRLSVGGMQLMGLEAPGPTTEKLTPRISETAKKLWSVYVLMTVACFVLLYISGISIFDSITTSFSTLATGGFSVKNASIGGFNNGWVEIIVMFFMFLSGMNYVLLYYLFSGKQLNIFKSSELRFYCFLIAFFIAFVFFDLMVNHPMNLMDAIRYSSFQVISIITTSGFHTSEFDLWPNFAIFMIFTLMFIGACAGSTSGSIKSLRILILIKKGYREINTLIKPRAVLPIRINSHVVDRDIVSSVTSFFLLFIFIFVVSILIISFVEDMSIVGSISASAAAITNVGPGFAEVGASQNYGFLSDFTKIYLCFLMLLGRLELYTILVLFAPIFWRK